MKRRTIADILQDYPDRYDLYRLNDKRTKFLADLFGISQDLNSTIRMCQKLAKLSMRKKVDLTLIEALTTAALIKYSRCFMPGRRDRVPKEYIDSLPDNLRNRHAYFIDLRSKFIAHSVNIFEDNYVSLEVLEGPDGENTLKGVTMSGGWRVGIGFPHLMDMISLCEKLLSIISNKIFRERDRLLEYYKTIPIDDLLKSTIKDRAFPSDKDVKKSKSWV